MQNPTAIAAVVGVIAVVVVVAALVLSGGGDKKKDEPNTRAPAGGGAVPTQPAASVIPTPTPQVVPTLSPQPQPQGGQPQPQPQPQPQGGQPQPQPQAGQVPPQQTSPFINLRVTPGGHGQTLKLGTPVELCYGVSAPNTWVRVYDTRSGEVLFQEGPDDGTGDCRGDLTAGPVGVDTVQADAYSVNPDGTRGAIRGSASLSMTVVP